MGLIEVPCKMSKQFNGYTEVTFQLADIEIEKIASKPEKYEGEIYRSIFVERKQTK